MLAYFFAFRYIMKIYISLKKAICLGSITKCDVIRSSGGLQSRAKTKPHLKTPSCGFFHNGAMVLHGVSFFGSWGRLQTTPSGLQGVEGISDASLASRDCTLSTGGAQES